MRAFYLKENRRMNERGYFTAVCTTLGHSDDSDHSGHSLTLESSAKPSLSVSDAAESVPLAEYRGTATGQCPV